MPATPVEFAKRQRVARPFTFHPDPPGTSASTTAAPVASVTKTRTPREAGSIEGVVGTTMSPLKRRPSSPAGVSCLMSFTTRVGGRRLVSGRRSIYAPGMRMIAIVVLFVGAVASAVEPPSGARLYAERCSACHGDDGGGDGPAAAALVPRPRNFRDAAFWRDRSAEQLRTVVRKGKPGTMMQPFEGILSDAEVDAVVGFVRHFDPAAK